jgi:hypothetical protein
MKIFLALFAIGSFASMSFGAHAYTVSSCNLIIDGVSYISGPCDFTDLGPTLGGGGSVGDFEVASLNGEYFAYVQGDSDVYTNAKNGYWNGGPFSAHAQTSFGLLIRSKADPACWTSARATVCARR